MAREKRKTTYTCRDTDPAWLKKVTIDFLDVYDALTCAHEEDEEVRNRDAVNPTIRRIRKAFPYHVSRFVLESVYSKLQLSGDVPPAKWKKKVDKRTEADPLTPVEDNPDEVKEFDARITEASRLKPEKDAKTGRHPSDAEGVFRMPRVRKFSWPLHRVYIPPTEASLLLGEECRA